MKVTAQESVLGHTLDRLISQRGIRHAVLAAERGDRTWNSVVASGPAEPGGSPMRFDTPFHYASVTKLYTAAVVLQLWEQGRLDLDAPISAYLEVELVADSTAPAGWTTAARSPSATC